MKFDEHLEAELGRVFSSIQIDEDGLYAIDGQSRLVQTRAPFFSARTLETEYFVVLHGADEPLPSYATGLAHGGLSAWQALPLQPLAALRVKTPAEYRGHGWRSG